MPKIIEIKNLKEGMVLAVPVKNKFGQLLIPEGTNLEERHKTILLTWGIQSVTINDSDAKEEIQYDEEIIALVKTKLHERFKWEYRNQNEEEIYNLALEELLKKTTTNN